MTSSKAILHRRLALHHLSMAQHLASITYPAVKDTKLLWMCIDNIKTSMAESIAAASIDAMWASKRKRKSKHTAKSSKRLQSSRKKRMSKKEQWTAFLKIHAKSHGLSGRDVAFLDRLDKMVELKKSSTVEFRRKDEYVLCQMDYKTVRITEALVLASLHHAKRIIGKLYHGIYQ